MARTQFPFASFPPFPAGELLADRVENEARIRTTLLLYLLLLIPAAAALIGVAQLYFEGTLYEASGRIAVVPNINPRFAAARLTKTGMKDHAEMLTGTRFREDVFRNLPTIDQSLLPGSKHLMAKKRSVHIDPSLALAGLKVRAGATDFLLTMTYRNKSPDLAAAVVSTALTTAETEPMRLSADRSAIAATFLNSKLDALDTQIQAEQAQLDRIQGEGGPDELAEKKRTNPVSQSTDPRLIRRNRKRRFAGYQGFRSTEELRFKQERADPLLYTLQQAADRAALAQRLADSRLRLIQSFEAAGTPIELYERADGGSRKSSVGGFRQHLAELQASYAALAATLGPQNPEMLTAQAQISALQKQLAEAQDKVVREAKAADVRAKLTSAAVGAALAQHKAEIQKQARSEVATAVLELELAVDLSVYEDYLQLLESQPAQAALDADSLDVVDSPKLPLRPMEKPYKATALSDATRGFFVGLFTVILLYYLRASIWRVHQAEDAAGMGVITMLPHMDAKPTKDGSVEILSGVSDNYLLGIQELRSNLELLSRFMAAQVVVITSASPSQGKTTTATNLAVRLAQDGSKVLLIDADLHRPVVHKRLGLTSRVGLSTVLSQKSTLEDAVQPYAGLPSLAVLAAGPPPPMPSELLQSAEMEHLLTHAREQYQYVLIDTAPVLAAGDAVFLSSHADLLFLLARFAQVELRLLRRTHALLSHSRVPFAGLIVNDVKKTWLSRMRLLVPAIARPAKLA